MSVDTLAWRRGERWDQAPGGQGPAGPRLLYTICFCRHGDRVLLLYRAKPPNRERWNGLGGRIEPGETPLACARREVLEEAAIDLGAGHRLRFAGVVTWAAGDDSTSDSTGMYAYVAELAADAPTWEGARPTAEGLLGWKPIAWLRDPANAAVASNIPHCLPHMLASADAWEYACAYQGEHLIDLAIRRLDPALARRGMSGAA